MSENPRYLARAKRRITQTATAPPPVAPPPPAREPMLTLSGELTIYTVGEQLQHIQQYMAANATIVFDLSAVTEIDSAGVQLLLVTQHEAARRNLPYRVHACSAAVQDVLELLRLAPPAAT